MLLLFNVFSKCSDMDQIISQKETKKGKSVTISDKTLDKKSLLEILTKANTQKIYSIIFKNCNFDNFAKCIQLIIKNKNTLKELRVFQFINCSPEGELSVYQNYHEPGIEIIIGEKQKDIQTIELKTNENTFISIKKPGLIGYTVQYSSVFSFVRKFINVLAFGTHMNQVNYWFTQYLIQSFPQKIKRIAPEVNRYIIKGLKTSYFAEFFQCLSKQLSKNSVVSYKISILNDTLLKDMTGMMSNYQNDPKKLQIVFLFFAEQGLFFNLTSLFVRVPKKYIYMDYPHPYKPELQKIFTNILKNTNGDTYQKIPIGNDKFGFSAKVNDRLVFIWDLKEKSLQDGLSKVFTTKEKTIYDKYISFGIDFIIFKLISSGMLKEQATELAVKMFLQYIFITKATK